MKATILTLYPEMFPGTLGFSLMGKALAEKKWELNLINIRDFSTNNYRSVDDTPFGGGAGMVMQAEVVDRALSSVNPKGPIYYLSPRGQTFTQATAKEWAELDEATFICGHFEGIDERVLEKWQVQEISLGDFVLSGGEVALMAMLDATIRLIPGVLGNAESVLEESFSNSLLEYPQYTKPQNWQGRQVPEILLSGNHAKIAAWRKEQSENLTKTRRPDLYEKYLTNQHSSTCHSGLDPESHEILNQVQDDLERGTFNERKIK